MDEKQTDLNLLFGLIAMQSDLIGMRQFVDACTLWGSRKQSSLAAILVGQKWLLPEDRQHVEYLLKRRMQKADGDARKSLAGMPDGLRDALEQIGDVGIMTLSDSSTPNSIQFRGPHCHVAIHLHTFLISTISVVENGLSIPAIGNSWPESDLRFDDQLVTV